MAQARDIEYRRLVSNIARELNDKDIEQIAYVRLAGKEDTTRYSAAKPCASALDLMKALENFDVFSLNNIAGLIEVVKDARRNDLVRKIEEYVAEDTERGASQCSARPIVKKKPARNGGQAAGRVDECKGHSSDCAFSTSRGGPHLAHHTKIAQELSQIHESAQDSPPTSSTKSTLQVIRHTGRPTSRGSKSKAALQKVSLKPAATVRETATPSKVEKRQKQLVTPTQLPIKLHSYTKSPSKCLLPPPHRMPPKKPPTSEVTDDRDRDSGMWTGSSSDDVTEWRKHIPDQAKGSEYQSIDKCEDHEYATPGMPVRI